MRGSFGRPLSFDGFSGRIAPDWDTPEVRAAIANFRMLAGDPSARVLLDSRNVVTSVVLPAGARGEVPAVLKSFGARGLKRLKTLVVPSKARKAWRGAAALVERGVPTAPPIAYWESRRGGVVGESYFLAARLEDVREVRFLFRELQGEALDSLLRDLGAFLRACHERHILHRDLSDGNILVRSLPSGGHEFYLLDTNRVRTRRRLGRRSRVKNLVRLGVPPDKQDYFLAAYGGPHPLPKRLRRWYKFRKAWYAGWIRVRKKLRLKTIARKLGLQ